MEKPKPEGEKVVDGANHEERLRSMVNRKDGFIFDLDGTIYLGQELIPGADRAIRMLRERGKKLAFVSNKPIQGRHTYAGKLNELGIPCDVEEVINSSLVCARYLEKQHPGCSALVLGEEPLVEELTNHGVRITENPEKTDVVVVSWDRTFTYEKLKKAYIAAVNGAALIGTNPDRTCPMPGYDLPDAACMIAALEACAERKVDPIVGKPSAIMIQEALDLLGVEPNLAALVGDRPETDMRMAHEAGISFMLVLSGVTGRTDLDDLPAEPDIVMKDVGELADL